LIISSRKLANVYIYGLRLYMKRAGAKPSVILKIYKSTVRPILEYAMQVWQNIPGYLSDRVESIQKRAYNIIYPDCTYNVALLLTKESLLADRRRMLCRKLMSEMYTVNEHPLSFLR
jgi:hypothetical protein